MGKVMGLFLDPAATAALGAANAMRLSYHPQALRPYIVNWEATAAAFIQWLHRDLLRTGDVETRRLLDELLSYPDVPRAVAAARSRRLDGAVPGHRAREG